MARTHAPTRDWRQTSFYLLVGGAMAVSIGGQVDTAGARIGIALAVVFALVNDGCAILALDCSLRADKGSAIRMWAWVAVLLAAGSGGFLNTWHAMIGVPAPPPEPFPWPLALILGVEPIVIVLVMSHLLGLVIADSRASAAGGERTVATAVAERHMSPPRPRDTAVKSAVDPSVRSAVDPSVRSGDSPAVGSAATSTVRSAAGMRSTAGMVATTGGLSEDGSTGAGSQPAGSVPRLRLAAAPEQPWMTHELIADVVNSMRAAARSSNRPYGEGRLVRDHQAKHSPLPDGSELTPHKAREIKKYIDKHRLLEAAS